MAKNATPDQLCKITFSTISTLQQPEHEIEVMADWEIREGVQVIAKGGFDETEVLDMSRESLSDFIARSCVGIADRHRQSRLEIVFPSQDQGLRREADQRRIASRIRRLASNRVEVRFVWE